MRYPKCCTLFLAAVLLVLSSTAFSSVVYVKAESPGPAFDGTSWETAYHTVREGLDAASSGGEVWVAGGAYTGCITLKAGVGLYGGFAGTETSREQRDWGANETVLDGNQSGSVVTSPGGATNSTVIDGFTIRNGSGTLVSGISVGGGILCRSSSPIIRHNTITANQAGNLGGAIYCAAGSSTIIRDNVVKLNLGYTSTIHCDQSAVTIAGNLITNNGGNGIACVASAVVITNNTIASNRCEIAPVAYAITCTSAPSPVIVNNILAFNEGGISVGAGSSPIVERNCIYGNADHSTPNDYNAVGITLSPSNVHADPQFARPVEMDCHIRPTSPCRNAGDNSASGLLDLDIDRQSRIEGGAVDIGADESYGESYPSRIIRVKADSPHDGPGNDWDHAWHTVNKALESSTAGDEVWVAKGAYPDVRMVKSLIGVYGGFAGTELSRDERLPFPRPGIDTSETVIPSIVFGYKGSAGPAAMSETIVDGLTVTAGSGVGFYRFSATLSHCTIRECWSLGSIICSNASPTITDCIITRNSNSRSNGGGISCTAGSCPRITNNIIHDNSASYEGGGIYCESSQPLISGNTVSANHGWHRGGGILLRNCPSATITGNKILQNSSIEGGGIQCENTPADIRNNIVAANGAEKLGSIHCQSSAASIVNNTIVSNYSASDGGGITCDGTVAPSIINNIIAWNSSGISKAASLEPVLRNNCVFGNDMYQYAGWTTDPTGTAANISVDPGLADIVYGNLHIQPDSPCLDVGDDSVVMGDWMDIDGSGRTEGSHVDIGADESAGNLWAPGPYIIVRVKPDGDDANDGTNWGSAKRTIQAAMEEAAAFGGEVWVAAGTYPVRIDMRAYSYLYGGFAGVETSRDARDWTANECILSTQFNDAVTVEAGNRTTTVDGLVLSGPRSTMRCSRSALAIANNKLTGTRFGTGALVCTYCSPTIVNNTIRDTSSYGIRCEQNRTANISGNVMELCETAVYLTGSQGRVSGNSLVDNRGFAVYWGESSGQCVGNLIVKARTGISCTSSSVAITSNTIVGCEGGIWLYYSSPTISDNIIAFNALGISANSTSCSPMLSHNCLYANTCADYPSHVARGATDISANPLFRSPSTGDFHIKASSPCRDAGDNLASGLMQVDMDDQPRIQGACVDIGADESYGEDWASRIIRVKADSAANGPGDDWNNAWHTVSEALSHALVGDELWVATGAYTECINLVDSFSLYGGFAGTETARDQRSTNAELTILDGNRQGSVVTAGVWVGPDSVLDGFTIRNGSGNPADNNHGGGIYCRLSGLTITNNIITGNTGNRGGGIYCDSGSHAISANRIFGNSAASGGGLCIIKGSVRMQANTVGPGNTTTSSGGGMYCDSLSSSSVLSGNAISGNTASGSGGGMYCYQSSALGTGNAVSNNRADGDGGGVYGVSSIFAGYTIASNWSAQSGGGISINNASSLTGSTISGNTASDGGGISIVAGSPTVYANVITYNSAISAEGVGGGILCAGYKANIAHNVLVRNSSAMGGGAYFTSSNTDDLPTFANNVVAFSRDGGGIGSSTTKVTLRSNCVYGNTGTAYQYITPGEGDISADPLFTDRVAGDFHLQPGSPCIHAGWASDSYSACLDIDGQPFNQGMAPDIGIDEVPSAGAITFDPDGGPFVGPVSVTISTTTPDAVIRYTTDGATPTEESQVYTEPVLLSRSVTLKARAWKAGLVDSGIKAAVYTLPVSVAEAKSKANGALVMLTDVVVTAVYGSDLLVESDDRSCGIRVYNYLHSITPGMRLTIIGTTITSSYGEKCIGATSVTPCGTGTVEPLHLANKAIGGGNWFYDSATGAGQKGIKGAAGLNNIGMLVRTVGKVTVKSTNWIYIDDGSRLHDNTINVGVKIQIPTGMTAPSVGAYVRVTGISTCTRYGTDLHRVLLATSIETL